MGAVASLGWWIRGLQLNEMPLRLPCGHVFGKDCLERAFTLNSQSEVRHFSCPLCRARLDIVGVGGGR